ncbi:hypothetical protein EMCRGX_G032347 [Ephydatia muelleri]
MDRTLLDAKLANHKGVFGYTPLHEATANGHYSVLDYLLGEGGTVNCRANSGYTPLHLAASSGHVECVKVLLKHDADISMTDEFGKTPKQTAELSSKASIVRLLRSEEIIKEVEKNGDGLNDLLRENPELEPDCLSRALLAAVMRDNHSNIGKLVIKGAPNIEQALELAKKEGKHNARAILLLVTAAIKNDRSLILRLFGESGQKDEEGFQEVQVAVMTGKVSTVVPIEMARRKQHKNVREELLLRTDVNQQEGTVFWHGLRLNELEVAWLRKIQWVKKLRLARNGFKILPIEIGSCLRHVIKLDLQYNELTTIPNCVLELPSLVDLNLSNNKLYTLPILAEWSSQLTVLDLSHNRLTTIPGEPLAPSIRTLNLADNDFRTVPLCVCNFITLRSLDISDNKNILSLPPQMGKLKEITSLNLKGLKDLNDPPKNFHRDPLDCMRYLRGKLLGSKGYYRMKLMLVGKQNRGKTTLVARLQGRDCGNESTVGVDVSVEELKPWLNNIALRAPQSCVLIVGTHLDEIPLNEREQKADALLVKAGDLASSFKTLQIKQVLAVGLKDHLEGVGVLRDAIYQCAAEYKIGNSTEAVMGQKIPASYHSLDKHIQDLQKEVMHGNREPIMHKEEYKSLIRQLNLSDIQDEDELKTATLFLNNVGTLLHYDDRSHNLDELYFIDPKWLCQMMAKIVTVKERNPFLIEGILPTKSIPFLFRDARFPFEYFEQYLTLLDRFEIALALDRSRILVPSMLSDVRPVGIDANEIDEKPLYIRHIFFTSSTTPPGFWSRLLSRVMHSIPQVWYALSTSSETECNGMAESSRQSVLSSSSQPMDAQPADSMTSMIKQPETSLFQLDEESFRAACPAALPPHFDPSQAKVMYWRTGLHYQDPDVVFRVESLSGATRGSRRKEGVVIVASPSAMGSKIVGVLLDLVTTLVSDWYPGMQSDRHLEQVVLCPECIRMKRRDPYQFDVQKCLILVGKKNTTVECEYVRDEKAMNHTIPLVTVVPDLLLQDINAEFLLDYGELDYEEEVNSVLGVGGFGKVYRGRCRGQSVAIKKYLSGDDALAELRKETMLLQQSHHPCLEAPMGSLERPLKIEQPIHRVVIHRIVAQVAAALKFLHNNGVIFRDLKAANVLLWSLDPESLCHCKVTDFGIATYAAPVGARGLQGTKGFIAPEILHVGKKKERSVYGHKADIFSFAMLLYQIISRKHPYYDLQAVKIDQAIVTGERPKLQDVPQAENAYFYLTRLMKQCWQGDPRQRPTTSEIIDKVSLSTFQSVMSVQPVRSRLSLRHACVITSTDLTEANVTRENELWVCCDGAEGTEISVYTTNTMTKVSKNFIKDNQVQCISLCGDHVWVASRAGIEYGVIDIFNIKTRDLVHNIRLKDNSVSCMAHSNTMVYCGTLEGYCFSFSRNIEQIKSSAKPRYKYVSENAVDGIVVTKDGLWLSHTHYIFFLNLETLAMEGSLNLGSSQAEYVGHMKLSADGTIVWSAQLGGASISGWSAVQKSHLFNVDIRKQMATTGVCSEPDMVITAITPALDTLWVGLAGGYIVVVREELLTWFCPYKEYVRFLMCIPCEGPCRTEKAMVVSGGKGFSSPMIPDLPDYDKMDEKGDPVDKAGTLIVWEAFPSKMCRQISMIQSQSSTYLDSHHTARQVIEKGEFKDGTYLIQGHVYNNAAAVAQSEVTSVDTDVIEPQTMSVMNGAATLGRRVGGLDTECDTNEQATLTPVSEECLDEMSPSPVRVAHYSNVETLEVSLPPDGSKCVPVSCPKPAQLSVLLSELEANAGLAKNSHYVVYIPHDGTAAVQIRAQEDFDVYLMLKSRPALLAQTVDK